jgi:hypothetical protein
LSLPIIGALLGHKHSATTAKYGHLATANDAIGFKNAAANKGLFFNISACVELL